MIARDEWWSPRVPCDSVFADFIREIMPRPAWAVEGDESEEAIILRVRVPPAAGRPEVFVRSDSNDAGRESLTIVVIRCDGREQSVRIPVTVDIDRVTAVCCGNELVVSLPKWLDTAK